MIDLATYVAESELSDSLKSDVLLLLGELSVVEKLRVQKAIELQKFSLLRLIPLKYQKQLKELKNPEVIPAVITRSPELITTADLKITPDTLVLETSSPLPPLEIVTELATSPVTSPEQNLEFTWKELIAAIEQARPNTIAVESLLKDPEYLGQPVEQLPVITSEVAELSSLDSLSDYRQIEKLDTKDVTFEIDDNPEQKMLLLRDKLIKSLGKKITIGQRRAVFLLFLHSPLFYKYSFTGLAALNVQSDLPRKIMLNVLQQNDSRFLNLAQFEWTAKLVKTLREVCII